MLALHSPLATASDQVVNLGDFLTSLRRKARLKPLLLEALAEKVTLEAAQQIGLSVATAELQQAAERFRRQHGLTSASATRAWLANSELSAADFEDTLERELLMERFKDHLAAQRATAHFAAHRDRYARVHLRQIVVSSDGLARELLNQLQEEGRDFAELARLHSLDLLSARNRGDIGVRLRCQLPAAFAEVIFATPQGGIAGPLQGSQGFHIFRVEALLPPELDKPTAAYIRRELFDDWLRDKLQGARIELGRSGNDDGAS